MPRISKEPSKSGSNQYQSMKQVSEHYSIPLEHMKAIKVLYPEGFAKGQVWGEKISKFYEDNKVKIIAKHNDSLEALKKQKLANDIILQELKIEEAKCQVANVKDVEAFMNYLGLEHSALLKDRLVRELPPRVTGMVQEDVAKLCKAYYNEIIQQFQKSIKEWNKHATE